MQHIHDGYLHNGFCAIVRAPAIGRACDGENLQANCPSSSHMSGVPYTAWRYHSEKGWFLRVGLRESDLHQQEVLAMLRLELLQVLIDLMSSYNRVIKVLQLETPLSDLVVDEYQVGQLAGLAMLHGAMQMLELARDALDA